MAALKLPQETLAAAAQLLMNSLDQLAMNDMSHVPSLSINLAMLITGDSRYTKSDISDGAASLTRQIDDLNVVWSNMAEWFGSTIAALKLRRYSLVPVGHLPVELLSQILLLDLQNPERGIPIDKRRKQLSLVTRQWHSVLTSFPHAWTEVQLGPCPPNPALTYSKSLLLDISYLAPENEIDQLAQLRLQASVEAVRQHSDRWRSLTIIATGDTPLDDVKQLCIAPTPRMEDLTIRVKDPLPTEYFAFPGSNPFRNVHLQNAQIPWQSSRLSSLSSLRLIEIHSRLPTLGQFLTMISSSPQLETLVVDRWWDANEQAISPESHPTDRANISHITLPFLIHLSIGDVPYAPVLLAVLHAASLGTFHVAHVHTTEFEGDRAPLVRLARPPLHAAQRLTIRIHRFGECLEIWILSEALTYDEAWSDFGERPGLFISLLSEPAGEEPILAVAKSLNYINITTPIDLDVTGLEREDDQGDILRIPPFPVAALDNLPTIESIRCASYSKAVEIIEYLSKPSIANGLGSGWPCPRLRTLDLRGVSGLRREDLTPLKETRLNASPMTAASLEVITDIS